MQNKIKRKVCVRFLCFREVNRVLWSKRYRKLVWVCDNHWKQKLEYEQNRKV